MKILQKIIQKKVYGVYFEDKYSTNGETVTRTWLEGRMYLKKDDAINRIRLWRKMYTIDYPDYTITEDEIGNGCHLKIGIYKNTEDESQSYTWWVKEFLVV